MLQKSEPGQTAKLSFHDPIARALNESGEAIFDCLRFDAENARIQLDDRRMLLLDATAFNAMRNEIVEMLGMEAARGIFTRVGYLIGSRDADLARKLCGRDGLIDRMQGIGPLLHALEGFVRVEGIHKEVDIQAGHCYSEFIWRHSVEHEAPGVPLERGAEAGCWMAVGHSSAFLTGILGRRVLVREVECEATGAQVCRAIAKPLEEWDNVEEDLRFFTVDRVPPALIRPRAKMPRTAGSIRSGGSSGTGSIVGNSAALTAVLHKIRRVATTDATVLLLGESGVGKSLFAREVHRLSPRHDKPFLAVNCAAIPEQLVESELFGVERGAYSGATEARQGRFEAANSGTLFLDEVGTLTFPAQGKLLRVLQSGELERLGSTKTLQVDVRVVAATNVDLQAAIESGSFREDLFYRLNVFPIHIPPLRSRRDDIPALLETCIERYGTRHRRHCPGITERALQAIFDYDWPGNVREFENVIERGVILAEEGEALDVHHLFNTDNNLATAARRQNSLPVQVGLAQSVPDQAAPELPAPELPAGDLSVWARAQVRSGQADLRTLQAAVRDSLIDAALELSGGNVAKAATMLHTSRHQLDYRLRGR